MNYPIWYWPVGIVVAIGLVVLGYNLHPNAPQEPTQTAPINTNAPRAPQQETSESPTVTPPPMMQRKTMPMPPKPQAKAGTFTITLPRLNEQWAWGEQHTISWSRTAGHTYGYVGNIAIYSAYTKALIGYINQGIAVNQTTQAWNTRDIYISPTSPLKKDIQTGEYMIKVSFGNNIEAWGPTFKILNKNEVQPLTYTVEIKNYAFSPASLTIARKDIVTFVNHDPVALTVSLLSYLSKTLSPGESFTVDTTSYQPGAYSFKLSQNTGAAFNLTVK